MSRATLRRGSGALAGANARDLGVPVKLGCAVQDTTWKAGRDVLRFRANPWTENLVATGGKENDLKVWDLQGADRTVPLFQARNVKNTKLDLRVPIAINDIQFLNADGNRLITGTAYHQVRAGTGFDFITSGATNDQGSAPAKNARTPQSGARLRHQSEPAAGAGRRRRRHADQVNRRRPRWPVRAKDLFARTKMSASQGGSLDSTLGLHCSCVGRTIVVGNSVGMVVLLDLRTGRTVGGIKGTGTSYGNYV